MSAKNGLTQVYTGRKVIVERIKAELESNGIIPIIKDGFRQGIEAGFGGGVPSAIDIFVSESDVEQAQEIINALIE